MFVEGEREVSKKQLLSYIRVDKEKSSRARDLGRNLREAAALANSRKAGRP